MPKAPADTARDARDPLNISDSEYEEAIYEHYRLMDEAMKTGGDDWPDMPDENEHPALNDRLVQAAYAHCKDVLETACRISRPEGQIYDDAYFHFTEGLEARLPVVIALVIEFLRERDELPIPPHEHDELYERPPS